MTELAAAFARCAARWVDQPAFFDGAKAVSYGELARQVRQLRQAFVTLGVGPGDRVAMLAPLRIEWVVSALAAASLAAEFVTLEPHADLTHTKVFLFDAALVLASDSLPEPPAEARVVDLDGDDAISYRGLIATGRAAVLASSPMPGPLHGLEVVPASIPLALGDRVVTSTATSDAVLRVWSPLLAGAALAASDDLLATCALVRPTIIIAAPHEARALADAMIAAITPPLSGLFQMKLAAARRHRALHASGRRSILLNLGHLLVDSVAGRHARAIFGHHLRLVVSTGALPALTRERFELVGISALEA